VNMGKAKTPVTQYITYVLGMLFVCLFTLQAEQPKVTYRTPSGGEALSLYTSQSPLFVTDTPVYDPNLHVWKDSPADSEPNSTGFDSNTPPVDVNQPVVEPNELFLDPNLISIEVNQIAPAPNSVVSETKTYQFEQLIEPNSTGSTAERTTELVGFVVRGRRLHERLTIDDLDSIVLKDGRRLLPLLRVLRAFNIQINEKGPVITFTPEGAGPVEIDLQGKKIKIKGKTKSLFYVEARSEITMKPDIYITPQDLSEVLEMELEWDNALYEYRIQLDRTISIWKLGRGGSWLRERTQLISAELPEVLPTADRSKSLLHFFEFIWPPSYRWKSASQGESSHLASLSSPQEIFSGNFKQGQYKLRISHPTLLWEDRRRGWHWRNEDSYVARADWFEWVQRRPDRELALGDSAFNIGELVFPTSRVMGIRVNGLTGYSKKELELDKSSLGFHKFFARPYIFEGVAPLDAKVELQLNDRTIAVQQVFPEADSAPGMGTYRFEDVELPSGILNEVDIVITEENGNEIRVEKSIIGTPLLLAKGHSAYLGVLGSRRDLNLRDNKNFEFGNLYGQLASGRILYGLSDRLTIGGMLGFQQDHYKRYLQEEEGLDLNIRPYPKSSTHAGGMFSYLPFDKFLLSGELATSQGQGNRGYNDTAFRSRAEYLPTEKLSLNLDFLNLGANYFDGHDPDICDRRGGELGISYKFSRKWSLESGLGQLRNNLGGIMDKTIVADYQNISLRTTMFPQSTLAVKLNRLRSSLESSPKLLSEFKVRTSLFKGLDIYGQIAGGDKLDLGEHREGRTFFSGLRLKNAPRFTRPTQYWRIRKSLAGGGAIGFGYSDSGIERLVSISHNTNILWKKYPIRVSTELMHNLIATIAKDTYRFRNRVELLLDSVGYNRLGVSTEYRYGKFQVLFYMGMRNMYANHRGHLAKINERRIRTAYGAIHGRVFLDYNGNNRFDPGEPGVPDVKVAIGRTKSTITDKNGYYILPGLRNSAKTRVNLDMDTVPAIYSVTHGTQLAHIMDDSLTEVNLSVAPLITITGRIVASDSAGTTKPVSGVRVSLRDPESSRLVADSVTAEDGTYYLDNIMPGNYFLQIDPESLPEIYRLGEQKRDIQVVASKKEFQEIKLPDFVASLTGQKGIQTPVFGSSE